MKYGIYDTQVDNWVKSNWSKITEGIPMTHLKSEAASSESREWVESVFNRLASEFKDRPTIMNGLEIREL